jgi:hypothetical protein
MKRSSGLIAATVVAFAGILSVGAKPLNATAVTQPFVQGYGQDRGWEQPPQEFQEMERRGFHDGVEAARKDYGNHRRPNVNNREEYRHPDIPRRDRGPYRRGFERGYRVGVQHIYNGQRF